MLNPNTPIAIRTITTADMIIYLYFFFFFFCSTVELGHPQFGQADNFISYSVAQSSHIINSGGVVPKVNIWYNIPVKMRRRVCPIRTDAPLFGIGYGGRGKEGRLEPQDYSGRAGETA